MRNPYFITFHKTMKKYINPTGKVAGEENKKFRQYKLYNDLFQLQLKGTPAEENGISEAQISRWIGGKEAIPNWILSYTFHDREECRRHYSDVFEEYVDEINIFRSMETEKKLAGEMCQQKTAWGICLSCVNQDDNLWDILADLLVTALICDYALNTVSLEIGLKQYLLETIKICKDKNIAFKTPFLLSVLFQTDHSLLPYTLNKLEKGLGVKWEHFIKRYVNAEHSQTFEEINLDETGLLNYARIHSSLNNKAEMDELELCCAVVDYPGSSNTLQKLKNTLWKYGYSDYKNWRMLLLQNMEELRGTSLDYWICD